MRRIAVEACSQGMTRRLQGQWGIAIECTPTVSGSILQTLGGVEAEPG